MSNSPLWVTSLVSFVAGATIAIFAEPIRRWLFRPRLRVDFSNKRCVIKTPTTVGAVTPSRGFWVRARVRNVGGGRIARGCRAYLVNVEIEKGGEFTNSEFADSLRLKWSSQPLGEETKPLDIPRDIEQFADVISTDKGSPDQFHMQTSVVPFYLRTLFDKSPKKLRLTIMATGDDATAHMAHFVFEWKGAWDTFEVSP